MIDRQFATEIQRHALNVITELTQVLNLSQNQCSQEEYERIKRAVGLSIGLIQTELLGVIVAAYPELDDLK